ncbi:MAG TPA: FAD-dependent oxidoreductase [Novosphingobium sp.]
MREQPDVIVIGGGLAGCAAALGAVEVGARVLLLEKAESGQGSTWQSAGSFSFAGTDLQRQAGHEDSAERLAADLLRAGGGRNDAALVRRFAERQLDAYDWLRGHGVRYERVQLSGGQGVPRSHACDPGQAMAALERSLASHPHFVRQDRCGAERLIRDAQGWTVMAGGKAFSAPKVVIASGGFSRSPTLIQTFCPDLLAGTPLGGFANTGDGLLMAMANGCGLVDMGYVKGTFGMPLANYPQPTLTAPEGLFLLMAIYRGALAVNREGQRFVNESLSYKEIGGACLAQPGGVAFQVFDESVMEQAQPIPSNMNFRAALERGIIRTAPTIAELAATVGLDGAALERTVARYNAMMAAGDDADFGRATIAGSVGTPAPLERGPYYILPCGVAVTGTFCGVRVDVDARLLDPYGAPIPGLFAAGEVTGGFHGESYMSGSALAKAAVYGRIAGQTAAAG